MNWRIHHVAQTDSTNNLALAGRPGDVFTADWQSAGRGRIGHEWLSRPGENLIMSAVLGVANSSPAEVATLPLVAGLAVADALSSFVGGIRLKWPNDVLVASGKKICGILCERHGDAVIAGIGVNVRQTAFAPSIAGRATSLALLGVDASVAAVRDAILAELANDVSAWREHGFALLLPRLDACDHLKGSHVRILRTDDDNDCVEGVCAGIAPDGALIVGQERIYAGEAHVLRDDA